VSPVVPDVGMHSILPPVRTARVGSDARRLDG
jgi:hypothetical protein